MAIAQKDSKVNSLLLPNIGRNGNIASIAKRAAAERRTFCHCNGSDDLRHHLTIVVCVYDVSCCRQQEAELKEHSKIRHAGFNIGADAVIFDA